MPQRPMLPGAISLTEQTAYARQPIRRGCWSQRKVDDSSFLCRRHSSLVRPILEVVRLLRTMAETEQILNLATFSLKSGPQFSTDRARGSRVCIEKIALEIQQIGMVGSNRAASNDAMPGAAAMNAVTLNLPDEIIERLSQLAAASGVTLDRLMQVLARAVIVADDAEARFSALATTSDRTLALAVLDRLDRPGLAP
jgi:hypothetical protein